MFTNILTATDLVRAPDNVVIAALKLAARFNAAIHILHVLESSDARNRNRVRHYITGEEIDTSEPYEKQVRDDIQGLYDTACVSAGGVIQVVPGFPWEEIVRWSRRLDAGLIVMGPHSARAAEKGVIRVAGKIGSTVEGVVSRENCPVMIINPSVELQTADFTRIVVGIDFSVSCECALAFAVRLAKSAKGRIFVFHMIPVPPYPKYSRDHYTADVAAATQRLTDFCEPFFDGVPHEVAVGGGVLPHREMIAYAEKSGADLIVLGSHTKEVRGKWYAGSVVERTGFRAACPVVVVTDPQSLIAWKSSELPDDRIGKDKDRWIHITV